MVTTGKVKEWGEFRCTLMHLGMPKHSFVNHYMSDPTYKVIGIKVTKSTVAKGVSKAIPVIGGVISGGLNFASMLPMAKRLYNAFDKATFDYSEEEFENDLEIIDKMANGEIIIEAEPSQNDEIKEKVSNKIKHVGEGVSGLIGKLGKKSPNTNTEDPIEQVKKFKELLDIGAIP